MGAWALQDSNTPCNSREKPHGSEAGAVKGAANPVDSGTGTAPAARPAGARSDTPAEPAGTLAAALAMIDRLPLTPAEKADAVRRLLADQERSGKP